MKPFKLLSLLVVLLGVVAYQPEAFGFVLAVVYALSGPVDFLLGRKTTRDDDDDIFHEMVQGSDTPEDDTLRLSPAPGPKAARAVEGQTKVKRGILGGALPWGQSSSGNEEGKH